MLHAKLRGASKLGGQLFDLSAFHEGADRLAVLGGAIDRLAEVGKVTILLAVDLVTFFSVHLRVENIKRRFFRADVGEKIFDALHIAVIDDLIAAAHGELWQTKVLGEDRRRIAGEVRIRRGKLNASRFIGGADKSRGEESAAEEGFIAFWAFEKIMNELFLKAELEGECGVRVLGKLGDVDLARFFRFEGDVCGLIDEGSEGGGDLL